MIITTGINNRIGRKGQIFSLGFGGIRGIAERASVFTDKTTVVGAEGFYIDTLGLSDVETAYFRIRHDIGGNPTFNSLPAAYHNSRDVFDSFAAVRNWDDGAYGTRSITTKITSHDDEHVITTEIEHVDPEVHFAGATWVVDPTGTFTGAPAGTQLTSLVDAIAAYHANGRFGRIRLLRGQTYSLNAGTNFIRANGATGVGFFYLDAWGAGAKPLIDTDTENLKIADGIGAGFKVVFDGVHTTGDYDAATGTYEEVGENGNTQIEAVNEFDLTLNDVTFEKCHIGFGVTYSTDFTDCQNQKFQRWKMIDCNTIGGFGNYSFFAQTANMSGCSGCDLPQDPNAMNGTEGKEWSPAALENHADHALRIAHVHSFAMNQNTPFSCNGWTAGTGIYGVSHLMAHQPLRIGASHAWDPRVAFTENTCEATPNIGPTSANGIAARGLFVSTKNYIVMTANMRYAMVSGHTGFYAHSNVMVRPNVDAPTGLQGHEWYGASVDRAMIYHKETPNPTTQIVLDGPVYWSHNTAIDARDAANVENPEPLSEAVNFIDGAAQGFTNLHQEANLFHIPRLSELNGGTISTDTVYLPRYNGMHFTDSAGTVFDIPEFATPATAAVSARHGPLAPVNLSDAASTYKPVYDMDGNLRSSVTSASAHAYTEPTVNAAGDGGIVTADGGQADCTSLFMFFKGKIGTVGGIQRLVQFTSNSGSNIAVNAAGDIAIKAALDDGGVNIIAQTDLVGGEDITILASIVSGGDVVLAAQVSGGAWITNSGTIDAGRTIDISAGIGVLSNSGGGGQFFDGDANRVLVITNPETMPDYTNAAHLERLIYSTGAGADPKLARDYFGGETVVDFNGAAARWTAGTHDGTATGFTTSGTFTDV